VGFEPTTSRSTIWRYYRLSYSRLISFEFIIRARNQTAQSNRKQTQRTLDFRPRV
jgi:hypothetical protein